MANRFSKRKHRLLGAACALALPGLVAPARAAIINVTPGSASALRTAVNNARAGDILVLSGTYNMGTTGVTTNAHGTATNRITIRAAAGGATLVGGTGGNGVAINHNYWTVENLTITGFQKSVRIQSADHGVLWGLNMSGSTGEAVKLRATAEYWLVGNCVASNTGAEGFYAGDADDNWEGGVVDRSGFMTFYNCRAINTTNDGFDFKEGTRNIKVVSSSVDWLGNVPGANAIGNSGIYTRCDDLQVIDFTARNNGSTGDVVRAHRQLALDNVWYGSGTELYDVAGENMAGWFTWNKHLDTTLYDNYALTNIAGGLYEPGSVNATLLPASVFVEARWTGIGGGRYFFTAIPEPAALGWIAFAGVALGRRRTRLG
jgi:hypothetical protein